ncbi:MAG: portal protein [Polyangiaceae bacterium]|nr:portal protein [Polyangiaceae bacterium]
MTRVREMRNMQGDRKFLDLRNATLYADRSISGFGVIGTRRHSTVPSLSLNVIRNMVQTAVSKIAAKNRPKPKFLTDGGDYESRVLAENLDKFVSGIFRETKAYVETDRAFAHACIFGTGFVKVYEADGRVCIEHAPTYTIVVDEAEGLHMKPRNMYQRLYIDRHTLAESYPDKESEIMTVAASADDREFSWQSNADQVLVTEAWHLAGPKSPGRHVIAIDNATLVDEEWEDPFPFAVIRWQEDVIGYFGVGIAEAQAGKQREINKLLQQIQKGHHLIQGHWMVQNGQTLVQQINNDLAAIVKYSGTPPTYHAPSVISQEIYAHLWQIYNKAFEDEGVSQMNATGQKPAGLDSEPAQRTYQDIASERFMKVGRDYEQFIIDIAHLVVRMAKKIGGSYSVRSVAQGAVEQIRWSDVAVDDPVIDVYPVSMIPSTPAGKLAWAQDMIQAGMIPPEDVLDIVDFPDTQQYVRRANASRRIIERNIKTMLTDGLAVSPEPFDDHHLALRLVNQAYHDARLDMVPDTRLGLLRDYMALTQGFIAQATPPPGPALGPMPGAGPMPGPGPGSAPMPMPEAA